MTRTLWELLREHKIDLTTAQHICNDAMINGVSVPCETARIEVLEAALREIANPSTVAGMHEQDRDRKLREIARAALAPEQDQ
jgi:hypothetical protein